MIMPYFAEELVTRFPKGTSAESAVMLGIFLDLETTNGEGSMAALESFLGFTRWDLKLNSLSR